MKAIFTVAATPHTLADPNASPAMNATLDGWPYSGVVQSENLIGGANPVKIPRGNVAGQIIFTSATSFSTYNACSTAAKVAQALVLAQGSLVVTLSLDGSPVTFTMANAILSRIAPKLNGKQLVIQYTFDITTIT